MVAVTVTIIIFVFGYLFASLCGVHSGFFGGLVAELFVAVVSIFNELFRNTNLPFIGACLHAFNGLIDELSCQHSDGLRITIIGGFLCCFNGCFNFDIGALAMDFITSHDFNVNEQLSVRDFNTIAQIVDKVEKVERKEEDNVNDQNENEEFDLVAAQSLLDADDEDETKSTNGKGMGDFMDVLSYTCTDKM